MNSSSKRFQKPKRKREEVRVREKRKEAEINAGIRNSISRMTRLTHLSVPQNYQRALHGTTGAGNMEGIGSIGVSVHKIEQIKLPSSSLSFLSSFSSLFFLFSLLSLNSLSLSLSIYIYIYILIRMN